MFYMTMVGMGIIPDNELLQSVEIILINGILFEDIAKVYALKFPVKLSVLGSAMASATIGFLEEKIVLIIR